MYFADNRNMITYFYYTRRQENEILKAYENGKRSREFKNAKELIKYLRAK
jgi:hypothetical protein